MSRTYNNILSQTTNDYLNSLNKNNPIGPEQLEDELMNRLKRAVNEENLLRDRGDKIKLPQTLTACVIAQIMLWSYHIIRVRYSNKEEVEDEDCSDLGIYEEEGEKAGLYNTSELEIERKIRQFNLSMTKKEVNEVKQILYTKAPFLPVNTDKNLIPVKNGIVDYSTKQLLPFTHEHVFTAKLNTNYNPNAVNPLIHNDQDGTDWDVESWINELSDDPEIRNALWEIIGAVVRPYEKWEKIVLFYSEKGMNGKGTLCEMMRNLIGRKSCMSIPLTGYSDTFGLEGIENAVAVIVDENQVKVCIEDSSKLKAAVTQDSLQVQRKFRKNIIVTFHGLNVQCINSLPRFKDQTQSFYRRLLFIPFEKTFIGKERKYIKHDYIKRPEVLEYVLYKVLNMNYESLSEPAASNRILMEYEVFNDPVRQFLEEILHKLVWNLVPYQFLYELYISWHKRNCPSGKIINRESFIRQLKEILEDFGGWAVTQDSIPVRNQFQKPEPLIAEFNMTQWMNPFYMGPNIMQRCIANITMSSVRGIRRVGTSGAAYANHADDARTKDARTKDAQTNDTQTKDAQTNDTQTNDTQTDETP